MASESSRANQRLWALDAHTLRTIAEHLNAAGWIDDTEAGLQRSIFCARDMERALRAHGYQGGELLAYGDKHGQVYVLFDTATKSLDEINVEVSRLADDVAAVGDERRLE